MGIARVIDMMVELGETRREMREGERERVREDDVTREAKEKGWRETRRMMREERGKDQVEGGG